MFSLLFTFHVQIPDGNYAFISCQLGPQLGCQHRINIHHSNLSELLISRFALFLHTFMASGTINIYMCHFYNNFIIPLSHTN